MLDEDSNLNPCFQIELMRNSSILRNLYKDVKDKTLKEMAIYKLIANLKKGHNPAILQPV